jgi:hypothetical protein
VSFGRAMTCTAFVCTLTAFFGGGTAFAEEAPRLGALSPAEFAQIDQPDQALGEPLRKRLKPNEPFCYGSDYDAAHLDQHPDQQVTSIRLSRGPIEIAATGKRQEWPEGAAVSVSVTTRDSDGAVQQRYSCSPEGDQWRCTSKASADAGCSMLTREVFLRRGAEDTITLANPSDGLPSLDLCSKLDMASSDDKMFKLSPMPLSECGLAKPEKYK